MWRIDLACDAHGLKLSPRSNTGQEKQMRRPNRSAAQHDFFSCARRAGFATVDAVLDSRRDHTSDFGLKKYASRVSSGDDREVRPLFGLALEESVIRARPSAIPSRCLEERHDSLWTTPVLTVVITSGDTSCHRCIHELSRALEYWRADRDPKWTVCVVRVDVDRNVIARREPLAFLEVR